MQLSTPWFRLPIGPMAQKWWNHHRRQLPQPSEEGRPDFVDPEASERAGSVEMRPVESGAFAWIEAEMGQNIPCVALEQGDNLADLMYDLDSAYEEAREKFDASLSPHTAFRALESGDNFAAIEFLERFGLLEVPEPSLSRKADAPILWDSRAQWLNLDHFWARHRRFVAIAKLWEAVIGNGPKHLPTAWAELVDALDQINLCGSPLLDPHRDMRIENWTDFPGTHDKEKFKNWLRRPGNMGPSREIALSTIQEEINANTADSRPWWHRVQKGDKPAFALALRTMSLWGAMWQFFARDTLGPDGAFALTATRFFTRRGGTGFSARPNSSNCTQNANGRERLDTSSAVE
jgi:hypothetical protein